MSLTVSSLMPTGNASVTRNRDQFSFPFLARPQAMTFYVRFIEQGTIKSSTALAWRIFHLGDQLSAKNFLICYGVGTAYRATYNSGGNSRSVDTASAPAIGDLVELRVTLTAGGVLIIAQTVNGGTEVASSPGAALLLPQQWVNTSAASDPLLWMDTVGGSGVGFIALLNCCVARGVQSLASMRRFANVGSR
jgi:hypothetical protein